eukprot:15450112-Alexandrium_andersonii.AAC.1
MAGEQAQAQAQAQAPLLPQQPVPILVPLPASMRTLGVPAMARRPSRRRRLRSPRSGLPRPLRRGSRAKPGRRQERRPSRA